jgi:hypothetical protein
VDYSERIYIKIFGENASIGFIEDESGLTIILKAPTNALKAIISGCRVQLLLGKDNKTTKPIIHSGVIIFDDPIKFMTITGANLFYEENEALKKILLSDSCRISFYNELSICVASANFRVMDSLKEVALEMIGDTNCLYTGDFNEDVISSLNAFDYTLDRSRQFENPYLIETVALDCQFSDWNIINNYFIGLNDKILTKIDDEIEGTSFENLVWFPIENLFILNIYKNPKYKSAQGDKEVTDILAFYEKGIFLIEAKSLSIFSATENMSMERKIATQQKHIQKAIKQLVGAVHNIIRGTDIFSSTDEFIKFNRDIVPHCIVLVSELLPFGDWSEIEKYILTTMSKERFFINVMDLNEFMRIIKYSQGRKEYFDFYLISRVEGFVKTKDIHMQVRMKPDDIL